MSSQDLSALRPALEARQWVYRQLREFFAQRGFLEVDTPTLVSEPGLEPHINPFRADFQIEGQAAQPMYLITSPEFALKKLLCAGYDKIFQISKVFRNGEAFRIHNPEFTMLEWYRTKADYHALMTDFEELLPALAKGFNGNANFIWKPPYERIAVAHAFEQYAGVRLAPPWSADHLREQALSAGLQDIQPTDSWDHLYTRLLVEKVEPKLSKDRPFFLVDFPAPQAALARFKPGSKDFAERFEVYVGPIELANGFSELTDETEQRRRFEADLHARETPLPMPENFLAALKSGMPVSAGVAMGVDRLLMVLLGKTSLKDVLISAF